MNYSWAIGLILENNFRYPKYIVQTPKLNYKSLRFQGHTSKRWIQVDIICGNVRIVVQHLLCNSLIKQVRLRHWGDHPWSSRYNSLLAFKTCRNDRKCFEVVGRHSTRSHVIIHYSRFHGSALRSLLLLPNSSVRENEHVKAHQMDIKVGNVYFPICMKFFSLHSA